MNQEGDRDTGGGKSSPSPQTAEGMLLCEPGADSLHENPHLSLSFYKAEGIFFITKNMDGAGTTAR